MKFLQTVSCLFYIKTLIVVGEGQNEIKGSVRGATKNNYTVSNQAE